MKVLYVIGRGRGGSTILANVLGEVDGFFSAGEVRTLWDPIVSKGGRCGCGLTADECSVWSHVIKGVDAPRAAVLQREVVRERNLPRIMMHRRGRRYPAVDSFGEVMHDVYSRLTEVTHASVIVDSSKRPSYAAFLATVPGVTVYHVHLVRDPRASAHSWKRRVHESATPGEEVRQRGALDSTLRWDVLNLEAEILRGSQRSERFVRLRYEDFVARPRSTVEELIAFVGENVVPTAFIDDRTVQMGVNHNVAGNPSRTVTGTVEIRERDDWVDEQRATDRWIATAVAAPFLTRYGYPVRLSSPRRRAL
jgi:hypothetical protein